MSSLLVLDESIELELVEYSHELSLKSGDMLLLDESLTSVELLLLDESKELVELDSVESDCEVRLESDTELDELVDDSPPRDSLDSLDELNSVDGSKIGIDAHVIMALVIGNPVLMVINPSPEAA